MNSTMELITWYFMRATGATALLLLTASVVLGILATLRVKPTGFPVSVSRTIHRNISLVSVVFLVLHIVTAVVQSHANVTLTDVVVPLLGSSHVVALALGTVAADLLIAIMLTSALKSRIGARSWRVVHWSSYLCWPTAFIHGLAMGTDVTSLWMLAVNGLSLLAIGAAIAARVTSTSVHRTRTQSAQRRTTIIHHREAPTWH